MKAFNPYAFRMAKTLLSVGISKCNCVKKWSTIKYKVHKEFEVTGHSRFSGRLFNFLSLLLYRAKKKCYIVLHGLVTKGFQTDFQLLSMLLY